MKEFVGAAHVLRHY